MCGAEFDGRKCGACGTFQRSNRKTTKTIAEKGVNLSKSVVKHGLNGFKNVSKEAQQRRLDICRGCELYNAENTSCNECGCYLNVKTSWASESCPLNKWGQESIPKNTAKTDCGCGKKG